MNATLSTILGVIIGFALARVPSGEISLAAYRRWRTDRRFARNNAACARGDHVDLTDADDNGVRWCAWCENTVHPNGQQFATGHLS